MKNFYRLIVPVGLSLSAIPICVYLYLAYIYFHGNKATFWKLAVYVMLLMAYAGISYIVVIGIHKHTRFVLARLCPKCKKRKGKRVSERTEYNFYRPFGQSMLGQEKKFSHVEADYKCSDCGHMWTVRWDDHLMA